MTTTAQTILHAKIEIASTHVRSEARALPVPIARSSVMLPDALALMGTLDRQKLIVDLVSSHKVTYIARHSYDEGYEMSYIEVS